MRKVIKSGLRFFVAMFVLLLCSNLSIVSADEIKESIIEALEYYSKGNYAEAVSGLDYAAQLIRQKRARSLISFLPAPLSGWKAKDAESQAAGQAMFGGIVSAKRLYHKDSSSVTVEIAADSPFLQSMVMVFSNMTFATADGGKLKKIKKQKAIVKYRPSAREGEITIVVKKSYLISIKGTKVSEEDLINYAAAINYKGLKKF